MQTAMDTYYFETTDPLWKSAIRNTVKSVSSPGAIDLGFKIFCRQNWTPWKQAQRLREPNNPQCKLCGESPSKTEHMYIDCRIADRLWKLYNTLISRTFSLRIPKIPETILFHQEIDVPHRIQKVIIDTMLNIKNLSKILISGKMLMTSSRHMN